MTTNTTYYINIKDNIIIILKKSWKNPIKLAFFKTIGPRKGKRDLETWNNGEMVSSQKYYGEGESITIQNWDDLKKLEVLGAENSSPDKEVYYDCISNNE